MTTEQIDAHDRMDAWMKRHGFCGCDAPAHAARWLRDLLRAISLHEADAGTWEAGSAQIAHLCGESEFRGRCVFILYWMTKEDWIEHGSSVGGSWLTDTGRAVLQELEQWDWVALEQLP